MVRLHCPSPIFIPIPIICRKGTLEPIPMAIPMQSHNKNYLKNHLIGTDIGVKLGTVAIYIRILIGIGPLYALLKKTIIPNSIVVGVGVGVGIGVGSSRAV